MKKKLAILMAVMMVLVLSLSGCGSSEGTPDSNDQGLNDNGLNDNGSSDSQENITVAVAWNSMEATTQVRMKYLEDHLGPALGIDFIFSEIISDTSELMNFLENSHAAGADALLSSVTDGIEQLVSRADELGVYTAVVSSNLYEEVAEIPTFMGVTGIDLGRVADSYGELIDEQFDSAEPGSFLIVTGGAAMGVSSHREATRSMLETLQEKYGLTYDRSIDDLAGINSTTQISTGNEDVDITIVPGFPNVDGYISGVSRLLQSGDYNAILSVYATVDTFATVIDEAEKALNKNITVLCQANFGETTKRAFETVDSTGNPNLDGAIIYPGTVNDAYGIVLLYNAVTGHSDVVNPEGRAVVMAPGPLVVQNAEAYGMLEDLDTRDDMYVYTADEVKEMLKEYNEDVDYDFLMNVTSEFSTEDIIERRGLQ
ncbi:hypothetical protein EDC19_2232 [Natranaerovirga hydrolytica]|uniref:ABC-type sugar transport system substrate-binding protein n=1 Tax=Natranaerovirga hydrolytica TaxID=680378 RepID=A0A4R1MJ64_9FIRM|nr:hypothetical protein [Natranaerovirga hydrolytica]TCK92497.1 hypothetical protein EDC19_2232 [Natranaerovirga hydrolytica]